MVLVEWLGGETDENSKVGRHHRVPPVEHSHARPLHLSSVGVGFQLQNKR